MIGAIAVAMLVASLPAIVIGVGTAILGIVVAGAVGAGELAALFMIPALFLTMVMAFVGAAYIDGGIWSFVLKVCRGEPYEFKDVFAGRPHFVPMLGAVLLHQIAITVGMMACYVPGIILAIGLMFFKLIIVDKKLGAIDALKASWNLTNGHKVDLFVFGLLAVGICMLGELACGIGLLVAGPIVMYAMAHIYLKLTNQPVAMIPKA